MTKPFRRLRKSSTKRMKCLYEKKDFWFFMRLGICLVLFLIVVGIRVRGGALFESAKQRAAEFYGGATRLSEAYQQSVEAVETFCIYWTQNSIYD